MPGVLTARPLRGGRRGGPKVALLSLLVHRNRLLVLQIVTFLMAQNALTPIFSLLLSARGPSRVVKTRVLYDHARVSHGVTF